MSPAQLLLQPLGLVRRYHTLVTYFAIGSTAALVDLGVFFALYTLVGLASPVATTLSVASATVYAFLLNAYFNFKATDRLWLRFLSYALVSGAGLGVSILLLTVFNVALGFDGNLVKIASLPIIFLLQYWLNKRITFQSFGQR